MEKLMRRIEEQKQGKSATPADIQELLKRDISWEETNGFHENGTHQAQTKVRKVAQGPAPPNYKGFSKIEDISHLNAAARTNHHPHSNQQRTENGTSVASKNVTKRKPTKPVAVVRKVAVYNEEAHQKNPTILTTDSWKTGFKPTASVKSSHPNTEKVKIASEHQSTAVAASVPLKGMTVAAKSAGSVTYRHPKTEEKEQEVASRPPVSKTAREILSEIQDEQKVISKQLLESNVAVKRKAKEPEKQAAVQQHQHPQEQIVSKAKTYDTDSIRQYMAKKRHLDKLKDRQNQEAERRRREEKEKRLRELERKRRDAASRSVKRPFHPEMNPTDFMGSERIIGMELNGDEDDGTDEMDGGGGGSEGHHDSKQETVKRANRFDARHMENGAVNLNTSLDSSDKENSKYSHRPRRLNNQPPVSNSIESGRSGPKIKFDVSDLLESSDYTLDEDRVSTAVRHQNKDSISTSEVNEQLKRSKALLAELNMKRMGIPSSGHANGSKVKMNRSLNDSNVSSIPVSDVVSKENQYDLNMQRPDSHFSDENQSSDFNNRLMKLSRAATDLRSRLSHETKTLADKINPKSSTNPTVQTLLTELLNGRTIQSSLNPNQRLEPSNPNTVTTNLAQHQSTSSATLTSSYNLRPNRNTQCANMTSNNPKTRHVLDPIEESAVQEEQMVGVEGGREGEDMHHQEPEEFQFPNSGVGWSAPPSSKEKHRGGNERSSAQNNATIYGDPLKFHKHGSKKRGVPNGVAHNDVPSKPVKWKLPEPQLHMVQLPPANSNAVAVMTTSTEPRVTTRTVMQHISKTGGPNFTFAHATDSYQNRDPIDRKEELDAYIKRILKEAELNSPDSPISNAARVHIKASAITSNCSSNGANGNVNHAAEDEFLYNREGGGDPFSVINIYTKQMAKEYSEKLKQSSSSKSQNQKTALQLELESTDDENEEQNVTKTSASSDPHNTSNEVFSATSQPNGVVYGEASNDPFKVLSPAGANEAQSPRDSRLSSESSELTEIAEAVMRQQTHLEATSSRLNSMSSNQAEGSARFEPTRNRMVPILEGYDFNSPRYSPRTLEQKLMSELNYLDSMHDSMNQLSDAEKVYAVANVQQETVALSQILKSRQISHEHDLKQLALKAKQETEDASRQLREAQEKANSAAMEAGMMQRQSEAELQLLARSEQLLESQQKAAQATSHVVQELTNLSSVARIVEGAESTRTPTTPVAYGRDRNIFDGQSAQEIATTAAVAAARAVIAENIQKSMEKVASRRRHDSGSSFQNRLRSRTPSETLSSTPTESLSPRSASVRKSPVPTRVQELSEDNKVTSQNGSQRSSVASPKAKSPVPRQEALERSRSQRSSASEDLAISIGSSKTSPDHQKYNKEIRENLEDSRNIFTENYSEIMTENSQIEVADKNGKVDTELSENIEENIDESLHSIGSLHAVEPEADVRLEALKVVKSQQYSTSQSIKSVASSKKDASSAPMNVNSLLSKSDSILSKYSPTTSPKSSPRPLDRTKQSASGKTRSSGGGDASIMTAADYSDDFDATTHDIRSKAASVSAGDKEQVSSKAQNQREGKSFEPKKLFSPRSAVDEKGRLEATMEEDCDGVSDDFSEEMLKQYLREEERRAQHQAALIKLREKALKDKAKAEMEYLDQLKAQNKGDADKMSTIKKRQRAVVIKLQEEQAELRRLELANKAGSQQRQLLMVQQREISKMRESTVHLKSKIRQLESNGSTGVNKTEIGDLEQLLKRSSTPTYLKSRKIKDLKAELFEEEIRLDSLRKNTAAAAKKEGGKVAHAGDREVNRSDSSSMVEDMSYGSNRSASDAEENHSFKLPASIPSSPRSLVGASIGSLSKGGAKLRVTPRTKSPVLPGHAAEVKGKMRRRRASSTDTYDESVNYSSDVGPASSYSDASDVEGRIQALKEDLRRRKEEVERLRQLKKGKRFRDREHARVQEDNIRKQLEYYDDYIAKTTAELEKADAENVLLTANDELVQVAKPVIRTPSARSSRSTTPVPSARNSESSSEVTPEAISALEPALQEDSKKEDAEKTPRKERSVEELPQVLDEAIKNNEVSGKNVVHASVSPSDEVNEDLSVAEEIDDESNSSTLEDEISVPIAKGQDDSDVVMTPRASTPVSSKGSGGKSIDRQSPLEKPTSFAESDNEPILSPAADASVSQSESASAKLSHDGSSKDKSNSEFDESNKKEPRKSVEDALQDLKIGSKVLVDGKNTGVLKFKSRVSDELLVGVELDDSIQSHDSQCDEHFTCKNGPGLLTSETGRIKALVEKDDTAVEAELAALTEDYSLDFDDKTTATATGTPRILASAASIKEEIEIASEESSSSKETESKKNESSSEKEAVLNENIVKLISEKEKSSSEDMVNISLPGNEEVVDLVVASKDETADDTLPEKGEDEIVDESLPDKVENEDNQGAEGKEDGINERFSGGADDEIGELNKSDGSDFESISFSMHEAESIGLATNYETIETGCGFISEPQISVVVKKPVADEDIAKADQKVDDVEDPPSIKDVPIPQQEMGDTDASECCDQIFDSVFQLVLDEVFDDRKLHLGFVDSYTQVLSKQCVDQALEDTFVCRGSKLTKLQRSLSFTKEVSELPRVDSIEEESSETIDELLVSQEEKLEVKHDNFELNLDERSEDNLFSAKAKSDVPESREDKVEPAHSPLSEELPDKSGSDNYSPSPSSPTAGVGGEFIDDDFGYTESKEYDDAKENIAPIVPPIDISEITSEPDRTQKPTLPESGVSVEEAALSARLSVHAERIASIVEPQVFIPSKSDEIKSLSHSFAAYFFNQKSNPEGFSDCKIPIELLGSDAVGSDDVSKSRKSFKVMMFELVREIVADIYQTVPKVTHPWMKPKLAKRVHYHGMKPKSIEMLNEIVEKKVTNLINLSSRSQHRTQTLKFGHKRRDLVDKILIQELREEESQWVDYNDDELNVKVQLTDAIFDSLIDDTVSVLNKIQQKHDAHST